MQVRPQVVNPQPFGPRLLLCRLPIEEQDVRFDTLSVEDASRQTEKGVDVCLFQQLSANRLAGSTFEQHVVRKDHGRSTVLLQDREEVLQEMTRASEMRKENAEVHLTSREIEIIRLIEKELSNKQIAEKLFLSERTVETHRKNIFRKTNTASVIGLVKYAYEHSLI